ncbi:MAG: glycosyltransferase family 2 protein [Candidatus Methanomethyliaceae archaeon]
MLPDFEAEIRLLQKAKFPERPYLSILIPCYNEANRVSTTLQNIFEYFNSISLGFEIVVIDDGSVDETLDSARVLNYDNVTIISYTSNKGKGYAIRAGVPYCRGSIILLCDADLSTPIWEFASLHNWMLEGYPIVIGSRRLRQSVIRVKRPLYRRLLGQMLRCLLWLMRLRNVSDTQCGFKLFKADALRRIVKLQRIDGFAWDIEALHIARKLGIAVKEVPIHWNHVPRREQFISKRLQMFIDLILIRFYDFMGCYQSGCRPTRAST